MQYMTGPIYMEGRENPEAGEDAKENRSVKRAFSENVNAGRTGEIWDMDMRERFRRHLVEEEKSSATVEKYLRDVRHFFRYVKEQPAARQEVTKEQVISWKEELVRSNILHDMKKLCREAQVEESKVFPHNLRHLFACTYYHRKKDIAHLADLLGHSNINTTRIYTQESGKEESRLLSQLGLVL